jgi:flagellar hook-associated protein 2
VATTIDGLITGLDTTKIIEGLTTVFRRRIELYQGQKERVAEQQTAFKSVEARLLTVQAAISRLARSQSNVFDTKSVKSSDEDLAVAAASNSAIAGTHSFRISNLATAHQIASQGFDSSSGLITQGTLQIRVGSGATTTITIDSTNNTLQGLADAINNSSSDVIATVLNDGTASLTDHRLLLTAKKTGASNAIAITNGLAADSGGAIRPDFATTVQAAGNASIILGSGAGELTVQSETNKVDTLINGVTINLLGADPAKTVQLSIENDTKVARDSVIDFVESYNELMKFIDEQVRFDPEAKTAGVLLGDRSVSLVQDDIRLAASGVVPGINTLMNRLGALGITTNSEGRLELNQSKLDDALAGRTPGVSISDVRRLFALSGQSTHGSIQFVTGSTRTKESATPYQIDISQVAERATITATNALAASTVIDGSNNTLTIVLDGKLSGNITLASGTYTQSALAQELQAQINANSALTGQRVSVIFDTDRLTITSDSYGLASEVKVVSGTALTALGLAGSESDKGQDVVGNFIVNGAVETAVGTGQFLMGTVSNANTADLQVRVSLTASQIIEGAEASLTVTRGVASRLDAVLNRMLDPVTGRLKTINEGFQDKIEDLDETIKKQNEMLESKQQTLLRQFIAMESLVSQLKSTGEFLSAQLASFTNSFNRSRK